MNLRSIVTRYFVFLDRQGNTFNIVAGLLCTALLGLLDYYSDRITSVDYTLAFFYLLPVSFVAWFAGREAGIVISLTCVLAKMTIQFSAMETISLVIWKNVTSLAFFLVITVLIAKLRQLLEHERVLSRTDHLTGAVNTRAFFEILTSEIYRQRRYFHPFVLAYIDIDNFKEVNDTYGHSAGDALLQSVVTTIADNLRRTDIIARLGGDEFAILLPDSDKAAGLAAINKIREQLSTNMQYHYRHVTFSIGLLSCPEPPGSADEILTIADNLMYAVKKSGKNGISQAIYTNKRNKSTESPVMVS